jgi:hypothetical protein
MNQKTALLKKPHCAKCTRSPNSATAELKREEKRGMIQNVEARQAMLKRLFNSVESIGGEAGQ